MDDGSEEREGTFSFEKQSERVKLLVELGCFSSAWELTARGANCFHLPARLSGLRMPSALEMAP